jgi:hypothetical protein
MTIRVFSACPFCRRVFEHDGMRQPVFIDGHPRRVCDDCSERMSSPASVPPVSGKRGANRPNGENGGGGNVARP